MRYLHHFVICVLFQLLQMNSSVIGKKSNNWAVLVCTSKYFFNYRHLSNVLAVYQEVKRSGIPDSQIILMNALNVQCDERNRYPGLVYDTNEPIPYMKGHLYDTPQMKDEKIAVPPSLCDDDMEIDYNGEDVNMKTVMALLTGRHSRNTPLSKRLNTNEHSNILFFISGHGGDEFMKFQDYEEISAQDIAHAIYEMKLKKRFKNMLFVVDTCQASTLGSLISTPNVISLSSSMKDENSYAYHSNLHLGLSVIDRFSYQLVEYLQQNRNKKVKSLADLYRALKPRFLQSTPVIEVSSGTVPSLDQIPLTKFFDERVNVDYIVGENASDDMYDAKS